MTKQFTLTKTACGWFNLRINNKLFANVPPYIVKKLIPDFNLKATLACYELDIRLVKEFAKNGGKLFDK